MTEPDRHARNTVRLAELYPTVGARIERVISILEAAGIRPRIQDAWRSPADQLKAYLAGRSKVRYGFHNCTSIAGQPQSLAVDMLDDYAPLSPRKSFLLQLAAAAEQAGLVTGIRWGLPPVMVVAVTKAIKAEDWFADVKVGWDPTHIQPIGITIAQAKAGQRPR